MGPRVSTFNGVRVVGQFQPRIAGFDGTHANASGAVPTSSLGCVALATAARNDSLAASCGPRPSCLRARGRPGRPRSIPGSSPRSVEAVNRLHPARRGRLRRRRRRSFPGPRCMRSRTYPRRAGGRQTAHTSTPCRTAWRSTCCGRIRPYNSRHRPGFPIGRWSQRETKNTWGGEAGK